MEKNRIENAEHTVAEQTASARGNVWLVGLLIVLLAATGISLGYGYRQHQAMSQLAGQDQELKATISQMRSQMDALDAKLLEMSTPPPAAKPAAAHRAAAKPGQPAVKRATAKRGGEERSWKQVQARLDQQQKQLKQTEEEIAKTRSDLEGRLSSTRDELNGSIARTHEELVALEKRGERNYYEFDLSKSKEFQRAGPVLLSLRKADTKHKHYDLAMLVEDNKLTKKKVNLYEPVWIHRSDDPQPVQVVVNRIEKNHVHGYVSAPKYKQSELGAKLTPASETAIPANPSATSRNEPQQPK